jgi:hypothetical protein
MKETQPGDRVRPCACQRLDGKWEVLLVRYSQYTDPLMQADGEYVQ